MNLQRTISVLALLMSTVPVVLMTNHGKMLYEMRPYLLMKFAGVSVPGVPHSSDGSQPCNVTKSTAFAEAEKACIAENSRNGGARTRSEEADDVEDDVEDDGVFEEEFGDDDPDEAGRSKRSPQGGDQDERRGKRAPRGGGRRRPHRGRDLRRAKIEKCVFQRLGFSNSDGSINLAAIKSAIGSFTGPDSGKQVLLNVVDKCFNNLTNVPPADQVGRMAVCMRQLHKVGCVVHDLREANSALGSIASRRLSQSCLARAGMPVNTILTAIKCDSTEAVKIADSRLAALGAKSRGKRSPQRGRGRGRGRGGRGGRGRGGARPPARKPSTGQSENGGREQKLADKLQQLEALFGPATAAFSDARAAIVESSRCWHQNLAALDSGDNVLPSSVQQLVKSATGAEEVKSVIETAYTTCAQQNAKLELMSDCVWDELAVSCALFRRNRRH